MASTRLGIDIGGTGIKGAPVDVVTGELVDERHRVPTPQPATPERVASVVGEVVRHFAWDGPIGATFPAVVKSGVVHTAANVDDSWIGTDAATIFGRATGQPVTVLNDAGAAGLAEMRYGAGRDRAGVVLMVTLGTGIGTALFVDGTLVPNTELGHIEIRGKDAEERAADSVRERNGLSWRAYAKRVDEYLDAVARLLWPDLVIIGGGASKKADRFIPLLTSEVEIVAAQLLNEAGIVGAALASAEQGASAG
ncbi:MAG: ROK family protein [Acidimicrobiia bacterium]